MGTNKKKAKKYGVEQTKIDPTQENVQPSKSYRKALQAVANMGQKKTKTSK
jgi:hypothetical protein